MKRLPQKKKEVRSNSQELKNAPGTVGFFDNRPEALRQLELQKTIANSTVQRSFQLKTDALFSSSQPVQLVKTIINSEGHEEEKDDDYVLASDEHLKHDPEKREVIDAGLADRLETVPKVGISNRPGLGFDESVFGLPENHKAPIETGSLPHGFEGLDYVPRGHPDYENAQEKAAVEKEKVQDSRNPENAASDLCSVDGLFIPGGQDRDETGSAEQTTRDAYEQALVKEARNIGMPTLAVCGGSRAFAKAFGAGEKRLGKAGRRIHKKSTNTQAHGLLFPEEHSLLGKSTPTPGVLDSINSTHEKIADLSTVKQLPPSSRGLRPAESELVLTATDQTDARNPEGFETRHGAPMIGVTSHPEAIYRGSGDRAAATPDARVWSDNIFKGYRQSMQTYNHKKTLHAEIRSRRDPEGHEGIRDKVNLKGLHTEGFTVSKLGKAMAQRNRQAKPQVYAKWRGKRNWQKLLSLKMITLEEAELMRQEVLDRKVAKKRYFDAGRPGHERPDPTG